MFDRTPDRSSTGSLKWDRYEGRDVLPFWVADMDFRSPQPVVDALKERCDHGVFGYTEASESVVEAVREYLGSVHGWTIDPSWLVWFPGMVPALNVTCRAFEGGVITAIPVYPPFLTAPDFAGKPLVQVPLAVSENHWEYDWDAMERAITPDTRVLLLCNPHNPVARVFRREELERVVAFCRRHDLVLCSDEIHCDLILDPEREHVTTASLGESAAARTIALFSPSKTYNLAGLACAYAVIPDPDIRRAFRRAARGIITEVNAMGYTACEAAYRHGEPWRKALIEQLRANRDRVGAFFSEHAPEAGLWPMEATYLAWIDLRAYGLARPAATFEKYGVGLSDGAAFGSPGFVRLNFGCPPEMLERGLERIGRAFAAIRADRSR